MILASAPSRTRRALLVASLLVALALLARLSGSHDPIGQWLFWRWAQAATLAAGWALACVSAGHAVVRRTLVTLPPSPARLALSAGVGVLAFYLGAFVLGLLHLWGPAYAVLWPLALFASGARPLARWASRWMHHVRAARRRRRGATPLAGVVATAFGVAGVALSWFVILSPENAAYDARWYHLPIAEHYVAAGGIEPFVEGWYQGALPHLSSVLYAWAFALPGLGLFDRVETCAHLELALFLLTLAAIVPVVRWAAPRARVRGAWAALFLFPGVLLYDSNLGIAADHVAAFFAAPILLALVRAWPDLAPRPVALLAALLGAALLTKYQAAMLVAGPALALLVRAAQLAWRGRARSGARGLGVALAVGALVTAPHWLKNWAYYGDPLYPFLHRWLGVRPFSPDAAGAFDAVFHDQLWRPHGALAERVLETLGATFTFAFRPHDWDMFHRDVPVFGALFTLALLALPWLARARRIAALTALCLVGVATWYWVSHQDRYLQALLPWLAAATAAILARVAEAGAAPRALATALVGLQVVAGGDVYFFPTNPMVHGSPVKHVADLAASGFRGEREARLRPFGPWFDLGVALPSGAKPLVHELQPHVGLRHRSVSDAMAWQGAITYGRQRSRREVHALLQRLGVTHLIWETGLSHAGDSLAADLVFFDYATRGAVDARPYGHLTLARVPDAAPDDAPYGPALVLGCGASYPAGLYDVADLTVPPYEAAPRWPAPRVAAPDDASAAMSVLRDRAAFVAVDRTCHAAAAADLESSFTRVGVRRDLEIWVRAR